MDSQNVPLPPSPAIASSSKENDEPVIEISEDDQNDKTKKNNDGKGREQSNKQSNNA